MPRTLPFGARNVARAHVGPCTEGGSVVVNAYWVTAGIGALVAVFGSILYFATNERFGLILILGGLVVAIMGLVMRLVMVYVGY